MHTFKMFYESLISHEDAKIIADELDVHLGKPWEPIGWVFSDKSSESSFVANSLEEAKKKLQNMRDRYKEVQ